MAVTELLGIEVKPSAFKDPTREKQDIWFRGQIIGDAQPYESDRWHVGITLDLDTGSYPDHILVQGIATSIDEAIESAILRYIEFHQVAVRTLNEFGAAMLARRFSIDGKEGA